MKFYLLLIILLFGACADKQTPSHTKSEIQAESVSLETTIETNINSNESINPSEDPFSIYFYKGQHLVKVQELFNPSSNGGIYWDSNKNIYFAMGTTVTNIENPIEISNNIDFQTFSSFCSNITFNSNLIFYSNISYKSHYLPLAEEFVYDFIIIYYDKNLDTYLTAYIQPLKDSGYDTVVKGGYEVIDKSSNHLPIYPTRVATNDNGFIITDKTYYTNKQGQFFYRETYSGIGLTLR
ncbi:MAG: hypothetical protein ACRCV0_00205 [Brevinema sp.]